MEALHFVLEKRLGEVEGEDMFVVRGVDVGKEVWGDGEEGKVLDVGVAAIEKKKHEYFGCTNSDLKFPGFWFNI